MRIKDMFPDTTVIVVVVLTYIIIPVKSHSAKMKPMVIFGMKHLVLTMTARIVVRVHFLVLIMRIRCGNTMHSLYNQLKYLKMVVVTTQIPMLAQGNVSRLNASLGLSLEVMIVDKTTH